MRASVRAGSSSPEEHVFFIYDRTALKSEWDDPATAILFFLPNAVSGLCYCVKVKVKA